MYICVHVVIYFNVNLCCIHVGAVAVVNTMECLDWLEKVLTKHWIPTADSKPPYRGMPLVILALDGGKYISMQGPCLKNTNPTPEMVVDTNVSSYFILS